MLRWCLYALGWLALLGFAFAVGWVAAWLYPPLLETISFLAVWSFALPILGGMSLLGALLAAGASVKAYLFGPNPRFVVPDSELSV